MNLKEVFGNAVWVGKPNEDGFFIIRGKFKLNQAEKVKIRALGLGFFECYINGKRISEDYFKPLSSEYEPRINLTKEEELTSFRTYVSEYDITDKTEDGENVIVLIFGGGWYCKGFGYPKAIWRIFGKDKNGNFDFVSSKNDKIAYAFITDYFFENHEYHDYTQKSFGGIEKDFDDSEWDNASEVNEPLTQYCFTKCPADKVCETIIPTLLSKQNDKAIYDCKINTAGFPVIKLKCAQGEKVFIRFSEAINEDGQLNEKFSHNQSLSFISDGKERIVHPLFTWFGFRYFEISGNAEVLRVDVIHTAVTQTSDFKSDNEILNWIHDAFVNTQKNNMHTGIPSDCPHLERKGYTGDGQLTCEAVMYMFDCKEFYRKWIRDIADGQDTKTGRIHNTAPFFPVGGGPGGWGCAIVEIPYQYYKRFAEKEILVEYYPYMLKYLNFLESSSLAGLVVKDKKGNWCLGEWCTPDKVILPPPFVNTYFYVKSLYRIKEIAQIIGKETDIPYFDKKIEEKKVALLTFYKDARTSNFFGNKQGANAFAVDIGIIDDSAYTYLVDYYEKLQGYDTGIFGTYILTDLLFKRGNAQLAVDLLTSSSPSSFAEMKNQDATTIWEYWPNSLKSRSLDHPMFGAIVSCFYKYLLGISGNAGYSEIKIAPLMVKQINKLNGHITIDNGKLSVSYEKKKDKILFNINVPKGIKAILSFGEEETLLTSGENIIKRNIITENNIKKSV